MNLLGYLKIGVVLAATAGAFFALQTWKEDLRAEGRAEVRAKWDKATAVADAAALATERRNKDSKEKALENQKKELTRNAAVVERIHVVTVRVQDTADAAVEAARTNPAACPDTAATFRELFGECRTEYFALGRAAQGHTIDVKALTESWPQCRN